MAYCEWKLFYNHRTRELATDWPKQLITQLVKLGIACTIIFKKHYLRSKDSRKKNCSLFTAKGHCKNRSCQVEVAVTVVDEPKNKENPRVFNVYVFGDVNHDNGKEQTARPLTGEARVTMGNITVCFLKSCIKLLYYR